MHLSKTSLLRKTAKSFASFKVSSFSGTTKLAAQKEYHDIRVIKPDSQIKLERKVLQPAMLPHKSTVIWLHGLGDSYEGFAQLMAEIVPKETRCVLPNAPTRSVTMNYGAVMRAWYDIMGLDRLSQQQDEKGILESKEELDKLIASELALLKNNRQHTSSSIVSDDETQKLIIGGFSQGGAMACIVGMTATAKLAGIVCCSGYVPVQHLFKPNVNNSLALSPQNKDTYTLFYHGKMDSVVPFSLGERSKQFMESLGKQNIDFQSEDYQDHGLTDREVQYLQTVFKKQLQ